MKNNKIMKTKNTNGELSIKLKKNHRKSPVWLSFNDIEKIRHYDSSIHIKSKIYKRGVDYFIDLNESNKELFTIGAITQLLDDNNYTYRKIGTTLSDINSMNNSVD